MSQEGSAIFYYAYQSKIVISRNTYL